MGTYLNHEDGQIGGGMVRENNESYLDVWGHIRVTKKPAARKFPEIYKDDLFTTNLFSLE